MSSRWDRFFAWVWRFDALAILALALAGLVGVGFILLDALRAPWRETPDQGLERVAGSELADENLGLSGLSAIAGTDLLYATLQERNESLRSGFGKGGYGTARNVFFFDTKARTARWLFEDHEQRIPSLIFLKDPPGHGQLWEDASANRKGQRVVALLLEVEPLDRAAGSERTREIAIAPADGRSTKTIVAAAQSLLGYHQSGTETLFVFYVADGAAHVVELDPATGRVAADGPLSTGP